MARQVRPEPISPSPKLLWALFAAIFLFYGLINSRELPWADARPIFEVAENLVHHGNLHATTRWPETSPPGRGGFFYAANPIVPSLIHVPGVLLSAATERIWPTDHIILIAHSSHIGPAAMGALTCILFLLLCLELGASLRAALLTTLLLALASPIAVYSRSPYSEISQCACFTGLALAVLRFARTRRPTSACAVGIWAGLLINTKLVYGSSLAGAALSLLVLGWPFHRANWRQWARAAAFAVLGLAPFILLSLGYNYYRFASGLKTGYPSGGFLTERPWVGLTGMLLSPGKSILLYSPPVLLSLVALPEAWRRLPRELLAMACLGLPPLLISSALICWGGDYSWGPRYLVFAVPVLLAPIALLLDRILSVTRRARRALGMTFVGSLALAGMVVQGLGASFYWDHFIRIGREAAVQWLGTPRKLCAATAPGAPPPPDCASCFEDMHELNWLPPFQPIAGHFWLWRHQIAKHDWQQAEKDAPWHRYTTLNFNIAGSYARARFDWWFLDYDSPAKKRFGIVLLVTIFSAALGMSLLTYRLRSRTSASQAFDIGAGHLPEQRASVPPSADR